MRLFEIAAKDIATDIEYHKNLNPKLWKDEKLKPAVKRKLVDIADHFAEYVGITKTQIKDIIVTGSNANYNWNAQSDIDLHVIADLTKIDSKILDDYLSAMKKLWNTEHDIHIFGCTVELYTQQPGEKLEATGVYSIKTDTWLKKPEYNVPEVNYNKIKKDAAVWVNKIDKMINSDGSSIMAEKLKDSIFKLRKKGLSKTGEFSHENYVFKTLRNDGFIEKLIKYIDIALDRELSLNETLTSIQHKTIKAKSAKGSRSYDNDFLYGKADKKNIDQLGDGVYSTVFTKPQDDQWVGKVRKWMHVYDHDTIQYLTQSQGNPLAPVVYNIKDFYANQDIHNFIDMERLTPVQQFCKKSGNSGRFDCSMLLQSILLDQLESKYAPVDLQDFADLLRYKIMSSADTITIATKSYKVKPQFIEISNIINELVNKGHGVHDLHIANFMVRLTPHGPQLVITDPIAS